MKSLLSLATILVFVAGCCHDKDDDNATTQPVAASATSQWQSFGEPIAAELPQVALAQVLADPSAFAGKPIEISGTVTEVCQHAGCWVRIADPAAADESVFVKFTCPVEGGRLIPLEAVGKPALVQGQIVVEEIEETEARHVAIEAGKSPEEVDAIVGPQKVIRVSSPAARVRV